MLHKLISRVIYFPSVLRMSLMVGPERRWYDRVDDTVLLGALPFRSQTKEVRICGVCVAFAWAFLWVFLRLASFPGLPRLQFLIACSVQKRSWLRFAYCKRSKAGFPPSPPPPPPPPPHQLPHQRWKAGQGLVLRQRGYWNILPMKNISLSFCSALEKEFFFSKAARQNLEWKLRLENCYCSDMYVCSLLIGNTHECTHITEYLHVYHY